MVSARAAGMEVATRMNVAAGGVLAVVKGVPGTMVLVPVPVAQ